jgi:hypothetical protein
VTINVFFSYIDEQMYNVPIDFPSSVVSVPVYSNAQISRGSTKYLTKVSTLWKKLAFETYGVDKDHGVDISNDLETLKEQYEDA